MSIESFEGGCYKTGQTVLLPFTLSHESDFYSIRPGGRRSGPSVKNFFFLCIKVIFHHYFFCLCVCLYSDTHDNARIENRRKFVLVPIVYISNAENWIDFEASSLRTPV